MAHFLIVLEDCKVFSDSPDAGDPACVCSACEEKIRRNQVPIRIFLEEKGKEYRFHPKCYSKRLRK